MTTDIAAIVVEELQGFRCKELVPVSTYKFTLCLIILLTYWLLDLAKIYFQKLSRFTFIILMQV